uniref:NADH-ubiquinone oxidoreductase chain 2 n=1 Tax=Johnius belangerii TaxID=240165 RepID=T1X3E4_JOHBE|nr:NADH dehydrogenase subunit 2 [Johnius belangerii]AGU46535.1 NADH dehydrogenase subunit 2 [Johnius belangerii]
MSPFLMYLLLFALGLGTTITFASSHWFLAWVGLEINTIAILPLMASLHHPRAIEATLKYFLIQATAASTLLFATILNAWSTGQWDITHMTDPLSVILLTLALALKVGLAPLHTWLPEVLQGLDLTTGLILSTWQKLAPFALFIQIASYNSILLLVLGLLSMLVGGWGGLNQTQLRKVLAYSSIAHLGWMVIILQFVPALSFLALFMYIAMTFSMFLVFKWIGTTNINALAISWAKAPAVTALMPLVLLSLGGLPPLSGFMPKWLILQELSKQDMGVIATLAALTALLSLYFYLRLSYAMTLTMFPNNLAGVLPWRFQCSQVTFLFAMSIVVTLVLLPVTPSAITLFFC